MLVLGRHINQKVIITLPDKSQIIVQVAEIRPGQVKLGFTAAKDIEINREEIISGRSFCPYVPVRRRK